MEFVKGALLAGKYRVERVLGRGGMGVVVAATHVQLEERVAVKVMLSEFTATGEAMARFVREARASAKLESHHVARVSDVGLLESGQPYMVMEFLEGHDLAQVLASAGPLPSSDAVDHVLQACTAIAEAHSLGIVHRDLKPSNLFLANRRDRSPIVKVLDFGISKVSGAVGSSDGAVTSTSAIMGSPLYMSPEQMTASRNVDARSDVWALGITLYELLTGTTPFVAGSMPEVCVNVLQATPAPLGGLRPDIPAALGAVVLRCLEKSPAARYADIAALAQALAPFAGRQGKIALEAILHVSGATGEAAAASSLVSAPHSTPHSETVAAGTNAAWGETRSGTARSTRGPALAVVGALTLAAAGAAWWVLASKTRAEQTTSAAAPVAPPLPTAELTAKIPAVAEATAAPTVDVAAPVLAQSSSAPARAPTKAAKGPGRAPKPPPATAARPAAPTAPEPARPAAAPSATSSKSLGGWL